MSEKSSASKIGANTTETPPKRKRSRRGAKSKRKALQRFIQHRNQMITNLFDHYRAIAVSQDVTCDTSYDAFERIAHIRRTFGKCEMGLTSDELLIMRYGHIVITTNTKFSFKTSTMLEIQSRQSPPDLENDEEEEIDSIDDVTWRTEQRSRCTCSSPSYWFTSLSCGNHSLKDSRYYYHKGDVVALGYVPLPNVGPPTDSGYCSSIGSDILPPCRSINVVSCGVTAKDEHLWLSDLRTSDGNEWKRWQYLKSIKIMKALHLTRDEWRRDNAPFVAIEVCNASIFLPQKKLLPACIEPGTMRQSQFRIYYDWEKFVKARGPKLVIRPPNIEVEHNTYLNLIVECPLIFTIHGSPIVRVSKRLHRANWLF